MELCFEIRVLFHEEGLEFQWRLYFRFICNLQYSCCSETGENDANTGDGNGGTIYNPSTNQTLHIAISNFQEEEVKQDGWTYFSFIARYLPPATLSGGSFVAPLADRMRTKAGN